MTLTIEELKYGAEVGDLGIDAVRAVCAEALANREAQPVLYASEETLAYAKEGEKSLVTWSEPMGDAVIPLFTAPPAPAVPDKKTFEQVAEEVADDIGGYSIRDCIVAALWWNACRAAMLAQPVSSGYTLPDSVLVLLNHIEDVLDDENWNRISVKKWNAVTMLAAAPEGGNG